jgi:O-antigen/teichoic acid export membrane protein
VSPPTGEEAVIQSRVWRGTASNQATNVLTLATGFFLTPFLLHQLGTESYGVWVLVGSIVAYGWLLDFGIGGAVTKYVAEYRVSGQVERLRRLVATALGLSVILGLVTAALAALLALVLPLLISSPTLDQSSLGWLVFLMGANVAVSIPCAIAGAVLLGLHRFDVANLISIAWLVLSTTAVVVVLLAGGDVTAMVAVQLPITLGMQVPSVWAIYRLAPELQFGRTKPSPNLVRTVAGYSWAVLVLSLAFRLQTKTDELVVGACVSIAAVTPYSIAHRLSEAANLFTTQFVRVLLPVASELHGADDRARIRMLYVASTRLTLAMFLPIGCILFILPGPLLTAWVGPEYADAATLVVILTLASLVDSIQWPAEFILQGMNRHRPLAFIALGSALANLGLSIILANQIGTIGVAIGTLVPTAVEALCFVLPYAMRVTGTSLPQFISEGVLPTVIPAIPSAAVLLFLASMTQPTSLLSLGLVAVAGMVAYGVTYLSFGAGVLERQAYRRMALAALGQAHRALRRT